MKTVNNNSIETQIADVNTLIDKARFCQIKEPNEMSYIIAERQYQFIKIKLLSELEENLNNAARFEGELKSISLVSKNIEFYFQNQQQGKKKISATFPDYLISELKKFLGMLVRATFEISTITNEKGKTKSVYNLINLVPIF